MESEYILSVKENKELTGKFDFYRVYKSYNEAQKQGRRWITARKRKDREKLILNQNQSI